VVGASVEYVDAHAVVLLEAPSGRSVFWVRARICPTHACMSPSAERHGPGGRCILPRHGARLLLSLVQPPRFVPPMPRLAPIRCRRCTDTGMDHGTVAIAACSSVVRTLSSAASVKGLPSPRPGSHTGRQGRSASTCWRWRSRRPWARCGVRRRPTRPWRRHWPPCDGGCLSCTGPCTESSAPAVLLQPLHQQVAHVDKALHAVGQARLVRALQLVPGLACRRAPIGRERVGLSVCMWHRASTH
jgi:hypothetical protein